MARTAKLNKAAWRCTSARDCQFKSCPHRELHAPANDPTVACYSMLCPRRGIPRPSICHMEV